MRYSTTGGDGGAAARATRAGAESARAAQRRGRQDVPIRIRMKLANAVVRAGASQYNSPDADRVSDRGHRASWAVTSHARSSREGWTVRLLARDPAARRSGARCRGQPIEVVAGRSRRSRRRSRGRARGRRGDRPRGRADQGADPRRVPRRQRRAAPSACSTARPRRFAGRALRARLEPGGGGPVDRGPARRRDADPARPDLLVRTLQARGRASRGAIVAGSLDGPAPGRRLRPRRPRPLRLLQDGRERVGSRSRPAAPGSR